MISVQYINAVYFGQHVLQTTSSIRKGHYHRTEIPAIESLASKCTQFKLGEPKPKKSNGQNSRTNAKPKNDPTNWIGLLHWKDWISSCDLSVNFICVYEKIETLEIILTLDSMMPPITMARFGIQNYTTTTPKMHDTLGRTQFPSHRKSILFKSGPSKTLLNLWMRATTYNYLPPTLGGGGGFMNPTLNRK